MSHDPVITRLAGDILSGSREALGKGITLIESLRDDHRQQATQLIEALWSHTGKSLRIAISGVPGAGKSTLIDGLGMALIKNGHRVAVLAIDPSSVRSGGSILGDKTRMGRLSTTDKAFIRPSPTSGTLGGVARRTREAMLLCEAAGYDVILLETVGVGQSEITASHMTDLFLLVAIAGAGDELQGIKRGILEIADFIVINKADGENKISAEKAAAALRLSLQILSQNSENSAPPVMPVSSLADSALEALGTELKSIHLKKQKDGILEDKRKKQLMVWFEEEIDLQSVNAIRSHPVFQTTHQNAQRELFHRAHTPTQLASQIVESCLLPRKSEGA